MDGGGAAAASIQVLVQNLISLSKEEISLIRGFEKDAEKLSETLDIIQKFLNDAEMRPITDEAVKSWLKKLEAVAFDADNVLDELNYDVLSKEMKTKKTMKKKVPSCFSSFNHIVRRRQMALTVKEINKNLESINKMASDLGLQLRLVDAHAPGAGSETDSFTVDPIFLGRDNDVSRIVEMMTGNPTDQVCSILPIVGMGGLGKTTLVRKVYGDEKIESHFGKRIWVHVSENFDPVILFKKILTNLTSENVEVGSMEVLLKKLQETLRDKTYLLVLDDVWNQDLQKWEGLPEDNCWSIIKEKAFGDGDIPSDFETTGRNIAKRCQGLPLAANVVGALLHGKSKDEWLSIEKNWLPDFGGDGNTVSKILKLSFDNLSSQSLKKCFAYCSTFPKGDYINRKKLIELWMAEGFLQTDQRNDMEAVGNRFFNLLVQNSLLQVVEKDGYGNVKHCNMHDLVHEVACSVLGSKVNDNNLDHTSRVRYIWCKSIAPIPREQAKCLRSIFWEVEVSNIRFPEFKSLHVLTLIGDDVEELPSSISKLIHLRYLDISYTRIGCLPDSIGELYHLQTLRAEIYLKKLPSTLKYLIRLRHLHISNIELPPEIGRLTSLQTLPYFQVGDEEGRGIVELGSLKNLRGKLEIHNLEKVHDKEEAKSADLFEKSDIFELKLVWGESREGEINDENVLAGLQPHPNLKSLEISGFQGRSFPSWILKMTVRGDLEGRWIGLNNLMEIKLSNCDECEEIPMLGHLPYLKSLYLSWLNNVTSIGSLFYGVDNCSASSSIRNGVCKEAILVFPALERFELKRMPNLTEWVGVELPSASETQLREVVVFPCLKYLWVDGCRQLMSAPSHFPCLEELTIARMHSGLPLSNISGIKLTTLTKLTVDGLDGLECLPDGIFYNNQNLSELKISSCPNLTHLVPCMGGVGASLKVLWIYDCSSLRKLPDDLNTLNSLAKLIINRCPNLQSIPSEMIESCAPSLEGLSMNGLKCLMNLPMVIGCLQKMPHLNYLEIANIPKFISNSALEIGSLRSLEFLRIGPPSESSDCISFKAALHDILQGSRSLRSLDLWGMNHWDSLPDPIQHLTALSSLCLTNFGIEALPEWFGNLSSLKELGLTCCEKLRRLPSKEAMLRLNKLTDLDIEDCPLLERCIEQQK